MQRATDLQMICVKLDESGAETSETKIRPHAHTSAAGECPPPPPENATSGAIHAGVPYI
jgi:hypothetical protein